jgi:hypothetical protein
VLAELERTEAQAESMYDDEPDAPGGRRPATSAAHAAAFRQMLRAEDASPNPATGKGET